MKVEPGHPPYAFSINGGRTEYNNFEIDGGDALDNGSNQTLNVYPSIDAIAEVKVLTSNFGAQYGRNGSGTVEVETKSGTNSFHGDLYEFLRNNAFNATPVTSKRRSQLTRRTTSASLLAGRSTFREFTTRTTARHFFSGRRSGGATASPIPLISSCQPPRNAPAISQIYAVRVLWRLIPRTAPLLPAGFLIPETRSRSIPAIRM